MKISKTYMTWALASAALAALGYALERGTRSTRAERGGWQGLASELMRGAGDKRHIVMEAATEAMRAFQRVMDKWSGSGDTQSASAGTSNPMTRDTM